MNNDERDVEFVISNLRFMHESELDMVNDLLRLSKSLEMMGIMLNGEEIRKSYNESDNNGELITIFQAGRSAVKQAVAHSLVSGNGTYNQDYSQC